MGSSKPRMSGMPALKLDRATNWWTAKDEIASFANYQTLFSSKRNLSRKSRTASLDVAFITPADSQPWPHPASSQLNAYLFFKAHERHVAATAIDALLAHAKTCGYPKLKTLDELQQLVDIQALHVLPAAKDRIAYVRLGFFSVWDTEHGVDVLLHRDRVVSVDADLDEHHAIDDGGTRIRKPRN